MTERFNYSSHDASMSSSNFKPKRFSTGHILTKLSESKDNGGILKAAKGKKVLLYTEPS